MNTRTPNNDNRPKSRQKFLLRFISGAQTGKEYALPEGKEVIIGRNPDIDLVLNDDLVSREHAKIICNNGVVELFDLGSTNGTFLYAEQITHAILKENDRIIIGASIMQLAKMGSSMGQFPDAEPLLDAQSQTILRGHIEEIPLVDLLQMLHINKKTGVVATADYSKMRGYIFIKDGNVIYSNIEGVKIAPLKAAYRLLDLKGGSFEFGTTNRTTFERVISVPTQTLLMESIKHNEELTGLRKKYPIMKHSIRFPRPMISQLADLPKETLKFLQLAYNAGFVTEYLNLAPASDVDAFNIIVDLIKKGYIETIPEK